MSFWKFSRTAASNGTADSTINYQEGQAASTLNDAGRGLMAALAKFRDDMSGAIVTGGIVNAYTVSSYQSFDSLLHLDTQAIAFSPHVTSTGAMTLNVDSLGAKPLRPSPGVEFIGGELIQGTPYVATYNNSDGVFYVRGFMSSPYAVPFLGELGLWDTIAPNSCFIFPQGQAISRTTYARVFAKWGTTFGAGDGSTTFNVPDGRGRVRAMIESAATLLTNTATGFNADSTVLGSKGGNEKNSVILTHNHTATDSGHSHGGSQASGQNGNAAGFPSTGASLWYGSAGGGQSASANITVANTGSASAHNICQPTITCNYVIRIL